VRHVIPLRADGTEVAIEVPQDLTQRDVDRLIRFLRALPAEEAPGEFHGVSVEGGILVQADTPEELARAVRLLSPATDKESLTVRVPEKPQAPARAVATVGGVEVAAGSLDELQEAAAGVWRAQAARDVAPKAPAIVARAAALSVEQLAKDAPRPRVVWTEEMREAQRQQMRDVWARRRNGKLTMPDGVGRKPKKSAVAERPREERRARAVEIFTRPTSAKAMSAMTADELDELPLGTVPLP